MIFPQNTKNSIRNSGTRIRNHGGTDDKKHKNVVKCFLLFYKKMQNTRKTTGIGAVLFFSCKLS